MNPWIALLLIMFGYAMVVLYLASRPAWLLALWRQIERPVKWIERKIRRTR